MPEISENTPLRWTDNPIDDAIKICEEKTRQHRHQTNRFFLLILTSIGMFVMLQLYSFFIISSNNKTQEKFIVGLKEYSGIIEGRLTSDFGRDSARVMVAADLKEIPNYLKDNLYKIGNTEVYIFYGIIIVVFSVFTSFYRFHLKEISKYEHFLFGFQRIRIAGNNSKTGYDDEVKTALTKDAFSIETKSLVSKEKKVESPIPGHPTSEALTFLVNKILASVEITAKPKEEKKKFEVGVDQES